MEGAFLYLNVTSAFILMIGMTFLLARLFGGPSLYDRALAVNSFGTKIVLFLCIFSLITGRMDGVDIAILYALMNFIATIAILKFFRYRGLTVSLNDMSIEPSYRPEPTPPVVPNSIPKKAAPKKAAPKKSTAKAPSKSGVKNPAAVKKSTITKKRAPAKKRATLSKKGT